jgi:transketolase C-terminal domain/subunit
VREDNRQDWSYNLGVISVLIEGEDVYIIASDKDLNIKKHKLNN